MKKLTILFSIFIIITSSQISAQTVTGRDVMVLVDERDDGDDRESTMEMILTNKRNRKRIRQIKSYIKDYGKDSKKVMLFNKPADVRGTSFLLWEYDDKDKEDDRWLYMPALRKVRRISGSSNNDYFMGSDFTYDDMGDRNVDEDTHKLLREEKIDGHECWVVESIPIDKNDMYEKKIAWVRKDVKIAVKVEYYDKMGLMKIFYVRKIKQVDGIWTIFNMFMDNLREKHSTELTMSDVSYNNDLKENIFTVSAIERGRVR